MLVRLYARRRACVHDEERARPTANTTKTLTKRPDVATVIRFVSCVRLMRE